jgi:2-succinyl-5-enolpyruvyl-6-hydroxy-3-cyclohexene-1-carboxylate synthase
LKSVGTKLRDDEYQALIERARKEGIKPYELVRKAILAYLNFPIQEPSRDEILDKLGELEKRIISLEQVVFKQARADLPQTVEQSSKSKKTAWDVLREQQVVCISSMKGAKDPEKIMESLKKNGAIILVSENDKCAVYPETWMSFLEDLAKINSPDEREVIGKLKGRARQLFKMIRAIGAVHFNNKTKMWLVDTTVIAKGEVSLGLEEVREEKAESKYVVRVSKEEAGDPESYITDMEREGWICNEKSGSIICVWRELLEQVVVDLNNIKVGVNDLEKALAGDKDKLEAGKAAYEAGILWYDGKEKRWRIVS